MISQPKGKKRSVRKCPVPAILFTRAICGDVLRKKANTYLFAQNWLYYKTLNQVSVCKTLT